jgi:hypothetical protein
MFSQENNNVQPSLETGGPANKITIGLCLKVSNERLLYGNGKNGVSLYLEGKVQLKYFYKN